METVDETHQRILSNIDNEYDKSTGSFVYDTTRTVSIEFENVDRKIEEAEAKLNIENLTGDELTQVVNERTGRKRKSASFAASIVHITGQPNARINKGDQVSNGNVTYSFIETTTLDANGQQTVLVQCDEAGKIGNTLPNSIVYFPVTLSGLTSVTNLEAVTNGYDEESDASLLERYFEYLQLPATSGNPAHYRVWSLEVNGVGDAKVYPAWNGGGTVKVAIIDSNKRAASEGLISTVLNHIEEVRPIGATVTVVSGKEKSINISANLVLANGHTISAAQSAYEESLVQHFANLAYKETYVSHAKVGNLLLDIPGVVDYSNLLINGGMANILLEEEEIPVLGTVSLEV